MSSAHNLATLPFQWFDSGIEHAPGFEFSTPALAKVQEVAFAVCKRAKAETPMDQRHTSGLCVSLVLAIVTIFLVPSPQGPYSVVKGPATVFQALRAATRVRTAIVRAGLHHTSTEFERGVRFLELSDPE